MKHGISLWKIGAIAVVILQSACSPRQVSSPQQSLAEHAPTSSQQTGNAPRIHVTPAGQDDNSGDSDHPLATLTKAVALSRTLHQPGQPITIVMHAGTYRQAATLTLDPRDSGLLIEGDGTVVISGGKRVTGWTPWKRKILKADLSALALPNLGFHELYYNSNRTQWARTPNFDPAHPRTGGFLENAATVEPDTKTKLAYREGELHPQRWAHPERAWVRAHNRLNYVPDFSLVKTIDQERRIVEFQDIKGYGLIKSNPYFLCGILEELDVPGEWCVDPDSKTLYFYPPSGDPNGADEVVIPVLSSIITLTGKPAENA